MFLKLLKVALSQKDFHFGQIFKKKVPNAQECILAPFSGDLSQSEKLFEINQPLLIPIQFYL